MAATFEEYRLQEDTEGLYFPSPQHVFSAGRCIHCNCDDHSLPALGESLSAWEKACPVDGETRLGFWSFGPEAMATIEDTVAQEI